MERQSDIYFKRYAFPDELLKDRPVRDDIGLIITIPCYKEPDILPTLNAIKACKLPSFGVEVIILINESEKDNERTRETNLKTWEEANEWTGKIRSPLIYHVLWEKNLPGTHAGVGLARKIAMDEAARRFRKAGNKKGIIAGLDGDSTVGKNYLVEIEKTFSENGLYGASIYFEHPVERAENQLQKNGIIEYELHLRYFILAQRYAGFPFAFHAVGSSMAVRTDIYQKQGGMNRRKAGEDFYFLHKIIPLANFKEINTTTVFPSPRISDRVPFGTGRAMMNWNKQKTDVLNTYHPVIFEDLKKIFELVDTFQTADPGKIQQLTTHFPESIRSYLEKENFRKKIITFQENSSSPNTFRDKFFNWFNALKVLQFVHYARDNFYGEVPVTMAYEWLTGKYGLQYTKGMTNLDMLEEVRDYDRSHSHYYIKK